MRSALLFEHQLRKLGDGGARVVTEESERAGSLRVRCTLAVRTEVWLP